MKWFKHDGNARSDEKIEKLLMRYGVEGYGLYFYCVEIIAGNLSSDNITFELKHDAETIAYRLKMDTLRVEEIMRWMVEHGLFQLSDASGRIMCLGLLKRLDVSTSNNQEFKNLIADSHKLLESNSNYQELIPEEKRREKKRKEDSNNNEKAVIKNRYLDHILLTPEEYDKLVSDYGSERTEEYIGRLDLYLEDNPSKQPGGKHEYKNHNKTIRTWLRNAGVKKESDMPEVII